MHRRNLSVVAAAGIALAVTFGNPSTANAAPSSGSESSQSGSSQSSSPSDSGAPATGDAGNSGTSGQISELQAQVEKLNAEMLAAADAANQATGQASVAKEAAKKAGEDYDAAVVAADKAKAKAYDVAADMYKQGPLSLEQMSLLTSNGPQDFIDKSTMMQQVSAYQSGYVNQMVQAVANQEAAKAAADQASADADAKLAEAQKVSADVQAKLTTAQQQLDALKAQGAQTGTGGGGDIPAYASTLPPNAATGQVTGDWAKPINGATLTSTYGPRWGTTHQGLDLAAPMQTPIYAAGSGTVLRAGTASGFGLAVYLQHPNGDVTVYGHINAYFVQTGQTVTAGQQIAEVGNRGYSTGPHLHFEVQKTAYGQRMDPMAWLNERGITMP